MKLIFKDEHRPGVQTFQIVSEGRILAHGATPNFIQWLNELIDSAERYKQACIKQNHEIEQTLGRALGYPKYSDDQDIFPGATEDDGVCVFDQIAETLAKEAARLRLLRRSQHRNHRRYSRYSIRSY